MHNSLIPFNESERETIKSALAMLFGVNFFNRLADSQSIQVVNNFDSLPQADQLSSIQRLAGSRSTLLSLHHDSEEIAVEMNQESDADDTGDSNVGNEISIAELMGTDE